ncbi:MAG: flagellar motor protein MotB [Synergistaceae bacterium]|nr:flagellar motor protein MotB [Synergistaceae bacterium]
MARQKKPEEPGLSAPFYMGTYGDMITLILCFFILLFAMSSIDSQKFQKALISLRGSLGVLRGGVTTEESLDPNQSGEEGVDAGASERVELDTRHVAYTINSYLRQEGLDKSIQVTVNQRGVSVSISDQFLFTSGSAEMRPEGQRVLYKIATLVRDKVPAAAVEGHTDSVPLRGGIYRDNWGLSAMRAAVVASYLETPGGFDPLKLQAVGFGPNQPIVPNDSAAHQALNRRVDIVFLSEYPKR